MKKIGILTFHNAINYGAALQAYALQQKLLEMGYESEIIDYENEYFKKSYASFFISEKSIKKFIYACFAYRNNQERNRKFSEFRNNYLKLSEKKYAIENIAQSNKLYDKFLVGSDQVWNLNLTHHDLTYLLDFCTDTYKKCSYSASTGNNPMNNFSLETYRKYLSDFHKMSTREVETAQLLKPILGHDVDIMIDPVFLLSYQAWKNFAVLPNINQKYILTYKLNQKQDVFLCAQILSRKTGFPVVALQAPYRRIPQEFRKERQTSPQEFVGWFQNAEYVLTDSFHGTAFSILFGKKFLSYLQDDFQSGDCRIQNILSLLSLKDRIGVGSDISKINDVIDYRSVSTIIEQQKNNALRYLNDL